MVVKFHFMCTSAEPIYKGTKRTPTIVVQESHSYRVGNGIYFGGCLTLSVFNRKRTTSHKGRLWSEDLFSVYGPIRVFFLLF